jgi:hypothetical protein
MMLDKLQLIGTTAIGHVTYLEEFKFYDSG